ncbi:MAG: HD domain-containing protein [Deltaproteobacteria bacterium]|nr:HD domain-containing protein [Deltaproteobacteria bacterium]
MDSARAYEGKALIADPIYQYILFTVPVPGRPAERTEKDLIDSPWLQRLRRIYQLQSARWVYPSAEHTRFQHSLGTMHMAGEFGKSLYPSLHEVFPGLPSMNYIEELLRVAGLLHDVGHGPFGHFFDDNFLDEYNLTHETIGQEIILRELGPAIRKLRRSPMGNFGRGESLSPRDIAFLIKKPVEGDSKGRPSWMLFLRQLFTGIYTVDNLDYVQRDAYVTGYSMDIVDIHRLCFYSFFTAEGLTLHQAGTSALTRFLNARLTLYSNVYFHRTTRALDLHLQEIFRDTMKILYPLNPVRSLDRYLDLDDGSLFQEVKSWAASKDHRKKRLGREWAKIHGREVKWKMSFAAELSIDELQRGLSFAPAPDYIKKIKGSLSPELKNLEFKVDLATQDPRPDNPIDVIDKKVAIFNPSTKAISREPLREIYRYIPVRIVHFRVFSLTHDYDRELTRAAEKVLGSLEEVEKTNI